MHVQLEKSTSNLKEYKCATYLENHSYTIYTVLALHCNDTRQYDKIL